MFTGTAEANSLVRLFATDSMMNTVEVGYEQLAGGATSWSITTTTLADGTYTITAEAVDLAGNVSMLSGSLSITVDTTKPDAPTAPVLTAASDSYGPSTGVDGDPGIGTNSDHYTNDNTPVFTGTAEANSLVRLFATDSMMNTVEVGYEQLAGGATSWSITTTTLADGTYTITAEAVDLAGNVSMLSGSLSITVDTTKPDAPTAPVLTAASDSYGPSTGVDGDPGIGTNSDHYTNDNTPVFTGLAEANSLVRLFATDSMMNTVEVGYEQLAGGATSWSITTTTLADGTYTITAEAVDLAGNVSMLSGSLSITVDTTKPDAPTAPVLTAASDSYGPSTGVDGDPGIGTNSDHYTNDNTPVFTGTAEANSLVRLFATDSMMNTVEVGYEQLAGGATSWSITTTTLADGTYTITAEAVDLAGNVSMLSGSLSITVDTTKPDAPTAPVLTAASDSYGPSTGVDGDPGIGTNSDHYTNDNTPVFTGTAEANSLVRLFATDSMMNTVEVGYEQLAGGATSWSITTTTLADGTYTITAEAVDLAGNVSMLSGSLSVTIDTTPPAAPSTPAITAPSISSGAISGPGYADTSITTPVFTGTAEANGLVRLFATDSMMNTVEVGYDQLTGGSTSWSITTSSLADGTYAITAKAVDLAGNISQASGGFTLTIDTKNPAPSITDTTTPDQEGKSLTLDGAANDPSPSSGIESYDWRVMDDNGQAISDGTSQNFTFTPIDNGTYNVTYTVTDNAGNVGVAHDTLTVANVAPTVSNLVATVTQGTAGNPVDAPSVSLSGTVSDPGVNDNGSFTINWGDGSHTTLNYPAPLAGSTAPYTYAFSGITHSYTINYLPSEYNTPSGYQYTISVSATDKDNATGNTATTPATVQYVPATVGLSDNSSGNAIEGTQYTLNLGAVSELGNYHVSYYSINWGDNTPNTVVLASPTNPNSAYGSVTHTYYAENPYTGPITVSMFDVDDGDPAFMTDNYFIGASTLATVVKPAAIRVLATNSGPANEGQGVNVTAFALSDPSYLHQADAQYTFTYTTTTGFHQSDLAAQGANSDTVFIPSSFISSYGSYLVSVQVTDGQSGSLEGMGSTTSNVTVNDVAPVISLASTTSTFAGSPLTLNGSFTDPGSNTWTALVDYNVGSSTPITLNGGNAQTLSLTGKSFALNDTYATPGTYYAEVQVSDGQDVATAIVTVTVAPATFHVVSFTPTSTGFDVQFNEDPNFSVLNLYAGTNNALGAPDLTIKGSSGNTIQGSLVWNAATDTASFVSTDSVLAPDTYTVTLVSGASAFNDGNGNLLAGSNNVAGTNYVTMFTVAPSTGPVLSLPDFARGPGQSVDVSDTPASSINHTPADIGTADSQYLPIVVTSTASSVFSVDFELDYNASYLTITNAMLAGTLASNGWSLSFNNSTPGKLLVSASGTTALAAGQVTLVDLVANVPMSALSSYGASALLQLSNVSFNEGQLAGTAGRGVEKVAYFGDVTGLAAYTSTLTGMQFQLSGQDATLISQNVVHLSSGFSAYPLTDPRIVGDVTGDGTLSGLDASFIAQDAVFLPVSQIPLIPRHAAAGNPIADPTVEVPSDVLGVRGQTVTLTVNVTPVDGLLSADLEIDYDPSVVDFAGMTTAQLNANIQLSDYLRNDTAEGWGIAKNIVLDDQGHQTGVMYLSLYSMGPALEASDDPPANNEPLFELLSMSFTVQANARAGISPVNVSGRLNEGQLSITPVSGSVALPVNATGGFSLTGTEGAPLATQTVATFNDPVTASEPATDYAATIDWNDPNNPSNDTTTGSITYDSGSATYTVTGGGYSYVEEGTYHPTVTIHYVGNVTPPPPDAMISDTVTVQDATLTGSSAATATGGVEGVTAATLVGATFSDANLGALPADFSGTIHWGDKLERHHLHLQQRDGQQRQLHRQRLPPLRRGRPLQLHDHRQRRRRQDHHDQRLDHRRRRHAHRQQRGHRHGRRGRGHRRHPGGRHLQRRQPGRPARRFQRHDPLGRQLERHHLHLQQRDGQQRQLHRQRLPPLRRGRPLQLHDHRQRRRRQDHHDQRLDHRRRRHAHRQQRGHRHGRRGRGHRRHPGGRHLQRRQPGRPCPPISAARSTGATARATPPSPPAA